MNSLSPNLLRTMIRHFWVWVACLLGTGVLHAQATKEAATDLPTAEQVIEEHLVAIGGREKLAKQTSSSATGKLKLPEMGLETEISVWAKAPNQLAIEFELPGAGKVRKATNGKLAWEINPMMGPRLIEGKEKEQLLKEADLHASMHHDKYYKSMETLEEVDLDGKACYKMKLITKDEAEEIRYYDVETYYLVRTEQTAVTPFGDLDIAVTIGDYRDVSGLMVPFEMAQEVMGSKQVFAFDSIEIDGEVNDMRFAIPAEIKELVDQQRPSLVPIRR